ncbi:hypothetical protein, partial [Kitasatospora sp. NPDC057198]|uniref:hypothetical protein n=1 Tax=Kitasatospora sp. NPDC057198 TaxID=3346046 RepID=UPI0036299CB2
MIEAAGDSSGGRYPLLRDVEREPAGWGSDFEEVRVGGGRREWPILRGCFPRNFLSFYRSLRGRRNPFDPAAPGRDHGGMTPTAPTARRLRERA